MSIIDWDKFKIEYVSFNPPDFLTHLNYVSCMCTLTNEISLECTLKLNNRLSISNKLSKKINLIKLTLDSINGEYKIIKETPDYAELCVAWISVKSYYLIFNLLIILNYLMTGSESSFNFKHKQILRWFNRSIKNNELVFSNPLLNSVYLCLDVRNTIFSLGANLKKEGFNIDDRCRQILKKLVDYKVEDLKREKNIPNFRKKKHRNERDNFLSNSNVSIFEFFYWYRIKANYRDLEFLDTDIDSSEFQNYYNNYFNLTVHTQRAFSQLINKLAQVRFNKEILLYES